MTEERTQRRLAAILAADVVGYSRLIEQDEARTLAGLKDRRKAILTPLVAQHQGRIVKVMGDGVLVEFASAVNAVACAVELQKRMASANDNLPEERRIVLRAGINLGDVVVEAGDIYGDGVNIAARLQEMAEPGGICISRNVHDEVRRKLDLAFEDAGYRSLKNITEPLHIYRIGGLHGREPATRHPPLPAKSSIAVLPFTNMSGDPEQQYFSDGITEDIITALSRFHELCVIARNSSFQYRGQVVDVKRVGHELGVHYVVEGSVRKSGSRVRITAQLVDAGTESHLWAEHYDREMQDLFAIQDEVTTAIVARVAGQIQAAGIEKARRKPPENLAAHDHLLRALMHYHRWKRDDLQPACHLLETAIQFDPNYAQAHALLARVLVHSHVVNVYSAHHSPSALERALELAKRAVELDSNDGRCHGALALVYVCRRSFDQAEHHLNAAVMLNPNDAELIGLGGLLAFLGRPNAALDALDRAMRLDPNPPNWWWLQRGMALYLLRSYDEAAGAFERMTADLGLHWRYRAACYAQLDRVADAHAAVAESLRIDPDFTLSRYAKVWWFKVQADLDHVLDGLRKAGLPE